VPAKPGRGAAAGPAGAVSLHVRSRLGDDRFLASVRKPSAPPWSGFSAGGMS